MNIRQEELYKQKYLKYKQKYLEAKHMGGHIKLVNKDRIEVPDEDVDKKHVIAMIKRDLGSGVYDTVDMHHVEHRVRMRVSVFRNLPMKFKGNKRKETLIEKYVLIETQAGGIGYKENYGDIIKVYYMDDEVRWLEDNHYIRDMSSMSSMSHLVSNVEFVRPHDTPKYHEARREIRELPPSDDEYDEDDEYFMDATPAVVDTSSDEDYFPPPQPKSKPKPKTHHESSKLDIDLHSKLEGSRNPYSIYPEVSSGVAATTHKWGQHSAVAAPHMSSRPSAAPSSASKWGQPSAAPSSASRWDQQRAADTPHMSSRPSAANTPHMASGPVDTTRQWDKFHAQRGEPESDTSEGFN